MHSNISGPTKAVCYREVTAIRGVCYKRFHCMYSSYMPSLSKVLSTGVMFFFCLTTRWRGLKGNQME